MNAYMIKPILFTQKKEDMYGRRMHEKKKRIYVYIIAPLLFTKKKEKICTEGVCTKKRKGYMYVHT